jgi:hypothetical protein
MIFLLGKVAEICPALLAFRMITVNKGKKNRWSDKYFFTFYIHKINLLPANLNWRRFPPISKKDPLMKIL